MTVPTIRDQSRGDWTGNNTIEDINAGSLQRIADAVEKMAASYVALQADRDYQKRRAEEESASSQRKTRSIRALRGVITRMRKRDGAK